MALPATDLFDRTDAANLGTGWTAPSGYNVLKIVSNTAAGFADTECGEYWNGDTWPADQYSEVVLGSVEDETDKGCGPAVRMGANVAYFAQPNAVETKLYKRTGVSTYTQISTNGAACTAGDTLRLEVSGTTLTVKKNGATIIGPLTDTALATGNAGLWCFTAGTLASVTQWTGGAYSAGGPAIPVFMNQYRQRAL